jgi:hypothetical protein
MCFGDSAYVWQWNMGTKYSSQEMDTNIKCLRLRLAVTTRVNWMQENVKRNWEELVEMITPRIFTMVSLLAQPPYGKMWLGSNT